MKLGNILVEPSTSSGAGISLSLRGWSGINTVLLYIYNKCLAPKNPNHGRIGQRPLRGDHVVSRGFVMCRGLFGTLYIRDKKDTGERMSSFLGVLRKVTMFHKERKQVTIKQTTLPQKAGNSVTSGNSYSKSSKKDQTGRGRVPYHGAITERDFVNIHHRIVRTT